jgi:hypothetical protein
MSPNRALVRRFLAGPAGALLVALAMVLAACSPATTPAPRSTITFLVQNQTGTNATYRFEGSATVADVTGPLGCQAQTTIGTTWDPTWTFLINDKRVIGSADSGDLLPGAGSHQALTVIIVIDQAGVRTTAHAGPPLNGQVATPLPSGASAPACSPAPGSSPSAPAGSPSGLPSRSPAASPSPSPS